MKNRSPRLIQLSGLLLSLLLALSGASCGAKKKVSKKAPPAATEIPGPGAPIELPPQIIRTIQRDEVQPSDKKPADKPEEDAGAAPQPPAEAPKGNAVVDMMIPGGAEAPRYPKDFGIGPLENDGIADVECLTVVTAVIAGLSGGTIAAESLTPGATRTVQVAKARIQALEPRISRFGGAKLLEDGALSFLVRFIGKEKSVSGELILTKATSGWKVDDLILDETDEPLEKEGVTFDPVDYKQVF